MVTESIFFTLTCIIAAVAPVAACYKQFQMLQQNSYYPSRYIKWLYDSYFSRLFILTLVFCALSVLFKYSIVTEFIIICIYLAVQVYSCFSTHKNSVKKLVFTARIKRLYLTAIILQIIVCILTLSAGGLMQGVFFSLLMLLGVFSPLSALISWALMQPVEIIFRKFYISDAKKIINSCRNLKVIGVTGSYGKTSTKFILARLLSEKFNVVATPQSFNTPLGVVKTIREKIRPQTQVFVCEMGAKNVGDIKEICDIVNPELGIITSVGPQHLETFKTVENVFKTKFELYDSCIRRRGEVFVNDASAAIHEHIGERHCTPYGTPESGCYAKNISYGAEGSTFTLVLDGAEIPVATRLLGRHNAINIAGAAAVANRLGVTPEDIRFAVSRLEPTEHRLELKGFVNGCVMIDDAYNANPEGCIEAVNVLANFKNMKKVIVTPGLVELGDKEYDFNYKLGLAAAKICDTIILVGKNRAKPMLDAISSTDFNAEAVYTVSSFAEAVSVLQQFADSHTAVLVENDLPDNYLK